MIPYESIVKNMTIFFFCQTKKKWHFNLKAEGHSISEHPELIPWSQDFRKKLFCKTRQCICTSPKNTLFTLLLDIKQFLLWKNPLQVTYTIEMVWPRQFIGPGLGVFTYLAFSAICFNTVATLWYPYLVRPLIQYKVFIIH